MHKIDLVGLSHRDPNVEKRLRQAFKVLRPNVMTLEYPSDQEGFKAYWESEEWQKKLRQIEYEAESTVFDPETNQVCTSASYANEVTIMQQLFEETKVPLFCVDDWRARIAYMMRINYQDFFKALENESTFDEIDESDYVLLEDHLSNNRVRRQLIQLLDYSKKILLLSRSREVFQRDRIKEILDECPYKKIRLMHVGGLAHLADAKGYTTLYRLLKKVLPKRLFEIRRHSLRQFEEVDNAV